MSPILSYRVEINSARHETGTSLQPWFLSFFTSTGIGHVWAAPPGTTGCSDLKPESRPSAEASDS